MANRALIIGGSLVGLGLLFALGSSKSSEPLTSGVTGPPNTRRLSYRVDENPPNDVVRLGPATALLDGQPVKKNDLARARDLSREFHMASKARKTVLPANADKTHTDNYSKEYYWGPSWLVMMGPEGLDATDLVSAINGTPFDEFGRLVPGHYGQSDQSLWGQTLGGLLKNPLFMAVVTVAVLAAPGGIAVYGAYTLWQMKGQEMSLQDAALAAGRSYVVAQCGPACGVAYDFGLGVAAGQPVDEAAEDALVKQMTPAERKAFDEGKRLAQA